jgi:hypothetical protein
MPITRTKHFRYREWEIGEILEKRSESYRPQAGNRFQTRLSIVIDGLATGTLVVGFRRRPNDQLLHRAQEILREWARKSALSPHNNVARSSIS